MFNSWFSLTPKQNNLFKKNDLSSTIQFEINWQREWNKFMNEMDDSVIDMIEHIDSKTQKLFFDLLKIILDKKHPPKKTNTEQDIIKFFKTLRQYRQQLFPAVNRVCNPQLQQIDNKDEKTLLSFLQGYGNDTLAKKMLFNTPFFDNCFAKGSPLLTQYAMDVFKRDISIFNCWLEKRNDFLIQTSILSEQDKSIKTPIGYDFILHNNLFASTLRSTIPVNDLNHNMLLAMGSNAMHKNNSEQNLIAFIRVIEKLPAKKQADISNVLVLFINSVLNEGLKNNEEIYDMQKIKALLTQARSPILKKELASFLKHIYPLFWGRLKALKFSDEEYKSIIQLTLLSHDWNKLFDLKDSNQNSVVWGLYRKGLLNNDDLSQIIKQAILQKKNNFLFAKKDMLFSSEIPCFSDLKGYFSDQPQQAYAFINSFQRKGNDDTLYHSVKSFIESPSFRSYFIRKNKVLNQFAQNNDFISILSFFYGKDVLNTQNPPCLINKKTGLLLSNQQDDCGKTLWHYVCKNKEKSLFRKDLKFLTEAFLSCCQIKDNDGKTPLEYVNGDLKFLKYLTAKIPQIEQILKKQGIFAEYVKQSSEEKKTPVTPQEKTEIKKETATVVAKKEWTVKYRGHDPYWKDENYLSVLKQEIQTFPDPYSPEIQEKQHREMKEHHYSAPAFKTTFHQKAWRVPYITHGETLYIFPGCERDSAYRMEHASYIKKLTKQLKQELTEHKRS